MTVSLDERTYSSDFSLVDPKACSACRFPCDEHTPEKRQLLVEANSTVSVISMEEVMSYMKESAGLVCDYMMDDGKTVALVEMTCSASGYVTSKRQKARRQLYDTLCLLRANPDVKRHLEQEENRWAIFSWKNTLPRTQSADLVESGMMGMVSMVDNVYSPDNVSDFGFGFLLREIRYPQPLVWN